jgi:4-aminobutyrate aminotransferase-like enzyme
MQLQKQYPIIGDVRGKGLMLGLELVVPGTKDALKVADVSTIQEHIKDLGILIGRGGRYNNVSVLLIIITSHSKLL